MSGGVVAHPAVVVSKTSEFETTAPPVRIILAVVRTTSQQREEHVS
jgi:hypothetical protein